jgi:Ni/Fe-hydrogenase subunit HybB-like protein
MKNLLKPTFWKIILLALLITGAYSIVYRFMYGLGAASAMNDKFPWGLWIGFDLLCGVGLAAGGFVICATVYIFNIQRFKPIIRPTILTAFLGYILVIFALLIDLGRPYRIWHALIMWNPKSVMFEVAWCVMLYTTVLFLEFSPVIFEKLKLSKAAKMMKNLTIPIVIIGVILSTLHQSSLGSLYLIVPEKMNAFWYSPLLPFFFFISAIGAGLAMVILESFLSSRAFKRELEMDLLAEIGKIMVVVLAFYLVLKIVDYNYRHVWQLFFSSGYEKFFLVGEILFGVILPMIMCFFDKVRKNKRLLFLNALLVILGFVTNRLNVSITGMEANSGFVYVPSFMELSITLFIVSIGFTVFALAIKYLNVFPEEKIKNI